MKVRRPLIAVASLGAVTSAFLTGAWAQEKAVEHKESLWRWPDSMDSVAAAPKNHKVLFENDHVRLLEVTVEPGETENMHGHKYPSVFMMDAPQPKTQNRNLEEPDPNNPPRPEQRPPRTVFDGLYPTCRAMTTPQPPHQITNVDTFPQHFYRMEFKKIDGDSIRTMKTYPAADAH